MMQDAVTKFQEGVQHMQVQDFQGAILSSTEAVTAFPQFEPAYRLRSEAYRFVGQEQASIADLQALLHQFSRDEAQGRGIRVTWDWELASQQAQCMSYLANCHYVDTIIKYHRYFRGLREPHTLTRYPFEDDCQS